MVLVRSTLTFWTYAAKVTSSFLFLFTILVMRYSFFISYLYQTTKITQCLPCLCLSANRLTKSVKENLNECGLRQGRCIIISKAIVCISLDHKSGKSLIVPAFWTLDVGANAQLNSLLVTRCIKHASVLHVSFRNHNDWQDDWWNTVTLCTRVCPRAHKPQQF